MILDLLNEEPFKSAIGPIVSAIFAYLVGMRISSYWDYKKRRREISISTLHEFNICYGEFYALWKKWNYSLQNKYGFSVDDSTVINEVLRIESNMEAIFVTIVSEKKLNDKEINDLGRFRQAFQSLRDAIKAQKELDWSFPDKHEYRSFKILACCVNRIIADIGIGNRPSERVSQKNLLQITSAQWMNNWIITTSLNDE